MAKYDALAALPGGEPGPWGEPVTSITISVTFYFIL